MLINGTDRRKFYLAKTVANVDTVTQEIHFFLFINPFLANVLILNPQKTPENQRFSGIFRGYGMRPLARNKPRLSTDNFFSRFCQIG